MAVRPDQPGQEVAAGAKRALRRAAAAARADAAGRLAPADAGARMAERLLASVPVAAGIAVSGYWPVVVARGQPLRFRRWEPGAPMAAAHYGILVPGETAPEIVPGLVLVPMLAFDRGGWRLGYGGGFYDRTLARLRQAGPVLAVGVAFAAQEVAAVPRDPLDQRLDWIVTECEAIRVA